MNFILFSVFWFLSVPPAAACIAQTVSHERIFQGLRAWIEARFPNTLLDYWIGCPVCLSYWVCALFTIYDFSYNGLMVFHAVGYQWPMVMFVYWLAAVQITTRVWIDEIYKK